MRQALLSLIMVLITGDGAAQEMRLSKALESAIDKLVGKLGIHANEPGVAILIHQPGKLLFQKGYGMANLEKQEPITPRTMFELASCSKPFTATAILILHDRKLLSIDDDVRMYVPELPEYRRDNPIHIRDLLTHTSGLPEYFDFEDVPKPHKTYWGNEDYLGMFAKLREDYPLQFRTGAKYDYCNSNFLLLATIIQRVSKKSYGQFLHDEIFVLAGMANTFVYESPQAVPANSAPGCNRAMAYEWRKKKEVWQPSWGTPPDRNEEMLIVGDGGVWTNLEDMTQWDRAVRARKFLMHETWQMALTPSKTSNGKCIEYGLGWMTYFDTPDALYGYGHDGSWGGFMTRYLRYFVADRTMVLLSNRGDMDTGRLFTALDKLLLDRFSSTQ